MSERILKAMRSAKASIEVEGLILQPEEEKLVMERLEGKITEDEFKKRILELIQKKD